MAQNPPVDDPKYGQNKFRKPAHSMYYYHTTIVNNQITALNFFYHNGDLSIWRTNIERIITELAVNAKYPLLHNGKGYIPPITGRNFGDVWRRKSLIVILLDEPDEVFTEVGAVAVIEDQADPSAGHPNYAFFDAKRYMIDVSAAGDGSEMRSAICFRNHMKGNHRGDDIVTSDGPQKFRFQLQTDVVRAAPLEAEGTNMGPPSPPPKLRFLGKILAWLLHS